MHKILKLIGIVATSAVMAACGGGGGDKGSSPFDGTGGTGTGTGSSSAATLSLVLSAASIDNSGAQTVTATATASDSSGRVLSDVPVTFTVDSNATYSQSSDITDSSGKSVATISIGSNPLDRVITVTAKSGSLTATAPFSVTGSSLSVTGQAIVAPGSTGNTVTFRLTNANGIGIADQDITVTAGSLGSTTGKTSTNGNYVYTYTAPASGNLNIVGSVGASGTVTKTLAVQVQSGSGTIPPANPILSASVQANPSVVATNNASTDNRTEIRALFVGAANAPVQNVRVRFDLKGDANSVGGSFSTGDGVIYSDAGGVATTAYIPGTRSSPTDGVTIRACYSTTDFAATACPNETVTTITIASDPLSVSIGSNSTVIIGPSNLTYRRQFVVLVVDSSGRAKANVDVVPSIDLSYYFKGQYVRSGSSWVMGTRVDDTTIQRRNPVACLNEDFNRNGVLETSEDAVPYGNHSGAIEPRKSDATITVVGNSKTDANGAVTLQVEYPQNIGSWLQVRILVAATGISGTEGRANWIEVLPVPVEALSATATPPFVRSPYGVVIDDVSPSNLTNGSPSGVGFFPDGSPGTAGVISGGVVSPCNNPY